MSTTRVSTMIAALLVLGCARTVEIQKFDLDPSQLEGCPAVFDIAPQGVYLPDPPVEQLLAAEGPKKRTNALVISTQVEIGTDGKVAGVELLDDGGAPAIAEVFAEVIRKWRYKPAIHNGQPVPTCERRLFVVDFGRT
jgi:hypothetical protein